MIKIAGVPEHFNLPWHIAIEKGMFDTASVPIQWIDVPQGTGKMCEMLRTGETDVAIILTEGIVKDIIAGNPSQIVQVYVASPLIWGIHVAAESSYQTIADLENKKIAISRVGSGSQLMAYVNARKQNWDLNTLSFEIVDTIDGAVKALTNATSDYFMWERFMTKPLVDQGVFRKIGDCPTPWPCFVIAVRNEVLNSNPNAIKKILDIINEQTKKFKDSASITNILASKYNLKIDDAEQWLSITRWSQEKPTIEMINNVQNELFDIGLIDKKSTFAKIVAF
jgi:ABC-type nitrate/sulfonate/bicarbonate transport system substrate-binding protein